MDIKDEKKLNELKGFLASKGLTQAKVAGVIGVTQPTVASLLSGKRKFGSVSAKAWSEAFGLSAEWLMYGTGSMLNSPEQTVEESVPAVPGNHWTYQLPLSAKAGRLDEFVESVALRQCEQIVSPIGGVDFAIPVDGVSMEPDLPNGSLLFVKRINEAAFIEWGKAYLLSTCNGSVVKTLVPSENPECVRCVSSNPDPIYAPFDVRRCDIYAIYKVLACMSRK